MCTYCEILSIMFMEKVAGEGTVMAQAYAHVNIVTCPWLYSQSYELNLGSWGLGSVKF